jgi:two-component system sensor histidine kinase and response regulator WspE
MRAVLAEISGEPYAFPLSRLRHIARVEAAACQSVQGRQQFSLDGQSVGLVRGAEILGLPATPLGGDLVNVIVIGDDENVCGLVVDRFLGEQDLVVRQLDPRLGRVPHLSAAAVQECGDPLLIVDIEDLVRSTQQLLSEGRLRGMASVVAAQSGTRRRVLVVDDSVTVREVERQLLRTHGYDVDVAVDGQDGWHTLCAAPYDLLITDVDMPRMNGIELIRAVRADRRFADLPVIVVSYKAREQDRRLGLEAGANAYLTKGSFHDDSFMDTVHSLVGDID